MASSKLMGHALAIAISAFGLPALALDLDADALSHQNQLAGRLERASDADLKSFYLHCSQAGRRSLGMGGVAVCSIGYELLLQRTFGGDFYALLAWSRRHSAGSAENPCEDRGPTDDASPPGI